MQSQFKENHELQKFKILDFQDIYDDLKMQEKIFEAFFMYFCFKKMIVNTLQHNYSDIKYKQQSVKQCFSNEI